MTREWSDFGGYELRNDSKLLSSNANVKRDWKKKSRIIFLDPASVLEEAQVGYIISICSA